MYIFRLVCFLFLYFFLVDGQRDNGQMAMHGLNMFAMWQLIDEQSKRKKGKYAMRTKERRGPEIDRVNCMIPLMA